MEKLSYSDMKKDIAMALETFDGIIDKNNWSICYPYGSYSNELLSYISSIGCKIGFTTEVRCLDLSKDNMLTIPRLDTNDFPPKSENYIRFN